MVIFSLEGGPFTQPIIEEIVCCYFCQPDCDSGDSVYCSFVRLWQQVTKAINNKDQTEATQEKYILEEAQRKSAKERKLKDEEWACKLFDQDSITGEWHYKYAE